MVAESADEAGAGAGAVAEAEGEPGAAAAALVVGEPGTTVALAGDDGDALPGAGVEEP